MKKLEENIWEGKFSASFSNVICLNKEKKLFVLFGSV